MAKSKKAAKKVAETKEVIVATTPAKTKKAPIVMVIIIGTGAGSLADGKRYQYPENAANILIEKGFATLETN